MADLTPLPADDLAAGLRDAQATKPRRGGLRFLNDRIVGGATFDSNTDFSGEFLSNVMFERCRFESAALFQANFSHMKFVECQFVGCNFAKSEVTHSVFENCRFEESRFQRTMFTDCEFTDTVFATCMFFAKSWFSGKATRTSFAGTGDQPKFIDDLVSTDVVWNVEPGSISVAAEGLQADESVSLVGTPGLDQLLSTLRLATVDSYDQQPISDDPPLTIADAYRQFEQLDYPIKEIVEVLSPYQRLSLRARTGQLCGRAITHQASRYLSAAVMVYEIGAAEDDPRHNYMSLAVYTHTLRRVANHGVEAPEPFPSATIFSNDMAKFIESLAGEPVDIGLYGLQEIVEDGVTKFGPIPGSW